MQYEIKRVPKVKEIEFNGNFSFLISTEKLKRLRSIVNELEENLNEKNRKFKYEIRLDDEMKQLEDIENLDPANVDIEMMDKFGIQLPNDDNLALKHLKDTLKTQMSSNIAKSIVLDGPVIPSKNNKDDPEQGKDKNKKNQAMVIDPDL